MTPLNNPNSAAAIACNKVGSGLLADDIVSFRADILQDVGDDDPNDDWCAAFASWAFKESVIAGSQGTEFPYSAGTQDILKWFNHWQPQRVTTNPQDVLAMPGAIYIATDPDADHGHMGFIVNRFQDSSGALTTMLTCEGNTTDPDRSGRFGAFIKYRQISMMGEPYGWTAVHYINVVDIAGGDFGY